MKFFFVLLFVFFAAFISFSIYADDQNNPRDTLNEYDPSVDQTTGTRETPEVTPAVSSGTLDSGGPVKKRTVNVRSSLNVRAGPWGRIIGRLRNNDEVVILGKEGDWLKIKFGDSFGYV
ncbi:SH3 domain-containing protein, partial [bacterium]|nr:SH3 domain-containing protein [bacterium]